MITIDNIAAELFNKIRSRFDKVTLGDEKGKWDSGKNPEKARFFNFIYTDSTGHKYGSILVSLVNEKNLKVTYSKNIAGDMDHATRKEWYGFLRSLRKFAMRHPNMKFDVRDISLDNFTIQDIRQMTAGDDTVTSDEVRVTESRLYGSMQRSYTNEGSCRLVIHHDSAINDDIHGARTRHINKIFVETELGERYLLPFKNLDGARAIARHITEGGAMHDQLAEQICNMVHEMSCMRTFVNGTKRRQFEDAETQDMIHSAVKHYDQLRRTLRQMRGARGHRAYLESFHPSAPIEEDVDIDALRERFVKKTYNDKFNEALPYVYRAHKLQQESAGYSEELEEWITALSETAWDEPSDPDKIEKLQELLSKPMPVGINGIDAINDIEDLQLDLPTDELTDRFRRLAGPGGAGPDTDARSEIKVWLKQHAPELLNQLDFGNKDSEDAQTNFAQPTSPNIDNHEYGSQPAHPNVSNMAMESDDSLDLIRSLAGLRR